jgi:hypothetical protein
MEAGVQWFAISHVARRQLGAIAPGLLAIIVITTATDVTSAPRRNMTAAERPMTGDRS